MHELLWIVIGSMIFLRSCKKVPQALAYGDYLDQLGDW